MKSTLSKVFIFAAGAAIGSAVTWKILKERYEQIAREEIESVKEVFSRREAEDEVTEEAEVAESTKPEEKTGSVKEYYESIVKEERYRNYANVESTKEVNDVEKPYVIKSSEFAQIDGYEAIGLFRFADGYLTDDNNDLVDDPDELVGTEYVDYFGKDERDPDTVYVRNDARRTDYEIMLDERRYVDVRPDAVPYEDEV